MPIYEYECPICKKIIERYRQMNSTKNAVCTECDCEAKKIISNSTFELKGGGVGWYASGYSKKDGKNE